MMPPLNVTNGLPPNYTDRMLNLTIGAGYLTSPEFKFVIKTKPNNTFIFWDNIRPKFSSRVPYGKNK